MRALVLLLCLAACRSPQPEGSPAGEHVHDPAARVAVQGDYVLLSSATGAALTLDAAADLLAEYDVVFLGEEHDNDVGHEVQLALTQALVARRGEVILSLEQLERHQQAALDAYLAGEADEDALRASGRLWPNYDEHYRPAVESMRAQGMRVLAANVPRALASRVVREGVRPVLVAEHAPRHVVTFPGAYRTRFEAVMGGHGGLPDQRIDNVFAAQCIKDAAMAESIADALEEQPGTLVVHWCGRFHSDAHLGTVERLALLRPDLKLGVVTMNSDDDLGRPLGADERADGDVVLRVPVQR